MAPLSLLASIEFVRLSVGNTLSVGDTGYAITAYPYVVASRDQVAETSTLFQFDFANAPRVTERRAAKSASCARVSRNAPR